MSQYKVFNFYHELPPWAKGVVIVGGGLAAWVLYSRMRSMFLDAKFKKGYKQESKSWDQAAADLEKAGAKKNYPDSQYLSWASELQSAYSGCDPWLQSGLTTGKVFKQLRGDADYVALQRAWGIRGYKGCLWEKDYNGTLSGAISEELLGATRDALNIQLSANGITYRV